jgi:hypothetical protein
VQDKIRDLLIHVVLGVLSGLAMALAAYLLIAPLVGPPPAIPFQDKIFHAVIFAALTGPAVLVLPQRYVGFWLAHMIALGAGIEIVQGLGDSERTGSPFDFLADLAGIFVAFWVGRAIRSRLTAESRG